MNRSKEIIVKETGMQVPYVGDPLSEALRNRVRDAITNIFNEELDAAVGAGSYERTESRRGYRHGSDRMEIISDFLMQSIRCVRQQVAQFVNRAALPIRL